MVASPDLVERSGDLKRELIDFAIQPRFNRAARQAVERRFGPAPVMDESELANFLDWFVLQERLPDGRTIVDHFVAEHPELPEEERAMLLGWHDVVEGIFEVVKRDGEALVVVSLLDELTYRVRSNMGPSVFAPLRPRSFLAGSLVPIGDEWLLSGVASLLPRASRADVYRATADLASQHPELVFRNAEKLARAWELQREECEHFIAFFGADLVVLPGHELAERMGAYAQYRMHHPRDAEGKSAAEVVEQVYGVAPPPFDFQLPPELLEAETVGMIYDEIEGLSFYPDFGLVEETFANPALAADGEHRQAVLGYLQEPSISPLPLRLLAERDPALASQVFQRVLRKRRFAWERDGEELLRHFKASFFARPVLPSVVPFSKPLSWAHLTAGDPPPPRPDSRLGSRRKSGVRGKRRRSR